MQGSGLESQLLILILVLPQDAHGVTSPCLEQLLGSQVLRSLREYRACLEDQPKGARLTTLAFLNSLLTKVKQPLLLHQSILLLIDETVTVCSGDEVMLSSEETGQFVGMLTEVCSRFADDFSLVDAHFLKGDASFPVFAALVPHIHERDFIGIKAREALLGCVQLSDQCPKIDSFVSEHSTFCVALATGLSGLYSDLPTDETDSAELHAFLVSLRFCASVVDGSGPRVSCQILSLVRDGFVVPVLCPALHQPTNAEAVAATCCLKTCIQTLVGSKLSRPFVEGVLSSAAGDAGTLATLDLLIARIDASVRDKGNMALVRATLRLFHALLELNSEEVLSSLCLSKLVDRRVNQRTTAGNGAAGPAADMFAASRALLKLRVAPESSPDGRSYRSYLADAAIAVGSCAQDYLFRTRVHGTARAKDSNTTVVSPHACFLTAILGRVERILHQPTDVKLLVTEIVRRLACYPPKILRDGLFSLDARASVGGGPPTLIQVLTVVAGEIRQVEANIVDFKAQLYALRKSLCLVDGSTGLKGSNGSPVTEPSEFQASVTPATTGWFNSKTTSDHTTASDKHITASGVWFGGMRLWGEVSSAATERQSIPFVLKPKKLKNQKKTVMGVLVYEEFLKELSAICLEHALRISD